MTSSPITSWIISGEKVETMTDFIFLSFKITADCDCSHEMKRCYDKPRQHIKTHRHCGGGNGNPLHYSCLENPIDRGTWWATVCGVAKSH